MSQERDKAQFTNKVNSIINGPQQIEKEEQKNVFGSLSLHFEKSFNFDNHNSLALGARQSIQNGIPIPFSMLSRSEDAFQLQNRQYQQNQFAENQLKTDQAQNGLIIQLGLEELISADKDSPNLVIDNTKNVLRNLGNAQNHYMLYNKRAKQYIMENISDPIIFEKWVRTLKLEKFQNFKEIWGVQKSTMKRIYRKLSWKFMTEQAIPYILSSRIKKSQTKASHLKHLYRFLEGIQNPQSFTYFKKN